MATYDVSTDAGKVRLLVGDTDVSDAHFSDSDIDAFLELAEQDVYLAAAHAAESWASTLAVQASDVQLGDYRQMDYHKSRELRALSVQLRDAANARPAFGISQKAWDGLSGFAADDIIVRRYLEGEL